MAKQYEPRTPFDVSAIHMIRDTEKTNGVNNESFTDGDNFYCSAKSYGGTEKIVNGVLVIEDTWEIDTWYNPAIKAKDRIRFLGDDTVYEVLARPENINRRGQWMRFKVVAIGG